MAAIKIISITIDTHVCMCTRWFPRNQLASYIFLHLHKIDPIINVPGVNSEFHQPAAGFAFNIFLPQVLYSSVKMQSIL